MRKFTMLIAAVLGLCLCACPAFAEDAPTGGVVVANNYSQSCRISINKLNIMMTSCGEFITGTAPANTSGTKIDTPASCPCVTEVKVKCGNLYEKTLTYTANYASACVKHAITIDDKGIPSK